MQEFYIHYKDGDRKSLHLMLIKIKKRKRRRALHMSYATVLAGDLPHVRESDAGVLHVRHPPSQLLADGVVGSLREATHPFHAQPGLPSGTSKRPIQVLATRARTTRGWRAPWSKGYNPRGGIHPPIAGGASSRRHLHDEPILLSPSDTDQVTVHLMRIEIQSPRYSRILERIAPVMTYADLWARE